MNVEQYVWNYVDSNSWLIIEGNDAILIDVVYNEDLFKRVMNLDSLYIILTHSHFDHICGLNKIREIFPESIVYANVRCSYNIGNRYKNMSSSANAFMTFYNKKRFSGGIEPFECGPVDVCFERDYQFDWKEHAIKLISFYGHSNDSLITVIDDKYMFSGDTLLDVPTITRFPGGSTEKFLCHDIPKLKALNVEIVYPGHGVPRRLNDMLIINDIKT